MAKRKESSEKLAWNWADSCQGDISQENMASVYRLLSKPHKPFTCRTNCRTNPHCLSGFGEFKLNDNMGNGIIFEDQRAPGTYVGLKNLGNTCYVSSLLQLWFHNTKFREAVYMWNALECQQEINKQLEVFERLPDISNFQPLSDVAHLQLLFAQMEFGINKASDPSDFCKSLSIDVELQQDAQEFNKLYMQRLERAFSTSSNEKSRNIIQEQFRGEYTYVTTCLACHTESARHSFFYELELNVKGFKTINESLEDFISEESLTGDNKYYCSVCNQKQDARTGIRLESVPPVLQLQLLRYAFDVTTATRKKVSQAIQFPDVLDMSPYLRQPPRTMLYALHAVLMHSGTSANAGHYYAHIKTNNGWHIFNDVAVNKQRSLSLINEDSPNSSVKSGYRSSSVSYMLVYQKINEPHDTIINDKEVLKNSDEKMDDEKIHENNNNGHNIPKNFIRNEMSEKIRSEFYVNRWHLLPAYVKKHIEHNNNAFLDACQNEVEELQLKMDHYQFLSDIISCLPPATFDDESCEFICFDILKNITRAFRVKPYEPVPPVDNSLILCPHNLLHFDKVKYYKVISKHAADWLLLKYGGGPRVKYSDLCMQCVGERVECIKMNTSIMNDYKTTTLLSKDLVEQGYWVGKKSFKDWWKLVGAENFSNSDLDAIDEDIANGRSDKFNSDIMCPHGNLTPDENNRRLVSPECWTILQKYFPKCPLFQDVVDSCQLCEESANSTKLTESKLRDDAIAERLVLKSLYSDKKEPIDFSIESYYLVSSEFVALWKKYIRSAYYQFLKEKPTGDQVLDSVLCSEHSLLLYDPNTELEKFAIITDREWSILQNIYHPELEISISKDSSNNLVTNPGVCVHCAQERLIRTNQLDLENSYFNARIYVEKVSNEIDEQEASADEETMQLKKANSGTRKRKQDDAWEMKQASKKSLVVDNDQIRRSTRFRNLRKNQNVFRIDKDTTLKALKIMILHKFEVMPSDQRLFLDDCDLDERKTRLGLSDSDATLFNLKVLPDSILRLVADEPSPDLLESETNIIPETGFKGTELGT